MFIYLRNKKIKINENSIEYIKENEDGSISFCYNGKMTTEKREDILLEKDLTFIFN